MAKDYQPKEKTDIHIGFKISKTYKDKLDKYCKKNDARVSDVVRFAVEKLLD